MVGQGSKEVVFDLTIIERKAFGEEVTAHPDQGWVWKELDLVDENLGGAPKAHRDALKLLAVFLQHGDNKASQQRLVCGDSNAKKSKTPTSSASRRKLPPPILRNSRSRSGTMPSHALIPT